MHTLGEFYLHILISFGLKCFSHAVTCWPGGPGSKCPLEKSLSGDAKAALGRPETKEGYFHRRTGIRFLLHALDYRLRTPKRSLSVACLSFASRFKGQFSI